MSTLFLPKGKAPHEENERGGGKSTGNSFNFMDLSFSTLVYTIWGRMFCSDDRSEKLGHSCFFLPLFFCLAPFCLSALFFVRSHQLSQVPQSMQQRAGCGRQEHSLLPMYLGDLGTCLLHSWSRNRVSYFPSAICRV